MESKTIYEIGHGDHSIYLRPMTYDPILRKWSQKNLYYVFNKTCRKIGSGSMGTVYLCNEYHNPDDQVAVKIVKEQYSSNPRIRLRAKLEASMSFVHPNVIEMLGYCEYNSQNGPLLVLSKYFEGQSINSYINEKYSFSPQRIQEICSLVLQALDGLSYIHSFKITHRDIKPSNIMVGENGKVKLMDLGIARVNGGNKFSSIGFVGTPEYASPEQIRGDDEMSKDAIGPFTDIYCMGITFYELLTGYNPFKASSDVDTMDNQLNMKLPSDIIIPSRLMKVIRKATEKDAKKRFQTAEEFRLAIEESMISNTLWQSVINWFKT